jgi:hypothetical protein
MSKRSSDRRQAALERERNAAQRGRVVARDAGLDLVGRATGWLAAGAIAVAGAVALYASHAFHPHQPAVSVTQSSPASSATSSSASPIQTSASGVAAAAPPPPTASSPVVSGGS